MNNIAQIAIIHLVSERTAITAEDLVIRYRNREGKPIEAVRGLSFAVQPGEIVGFLGPNGAGKSSTLKAIMGFLEPAEGRCTVFDEPVGTPESRRRIGYLPEVAMYYPFLTPLETLRLYGELQGLRGSALRQEATDLLTLVGLKEALHKQNRSLSKGMLQRVGIAQSLLGRPDLLVLDEVTSGLDPIGRRELRDILRARQSEGTTLFFSSHELAEVDLLCDRILIVHEGRMVEEARMQDLRDRLREHTIVYRAPGAIPLTDADLEPCPEGTRARFHSKQALLIGLDQLRTAGAEITDLAAQEGDLEAYFIRTVGGAA